MTVGQDARLFDLGYRILEHRVISDDVSDIRQTLERQCNGDGRVDVLVAAAGIYAVLSIMRRSFSKLYLSTPPGG